MNWTSLLRCEMSVMSFGLRLRNKDKTKGKKTEATKNIRNTPCYSILLLFHPHPIDRMFF